MSKPRKSKRHSKVGRTPIISAVIIAIAIVAVVAVNAYVLTKKNRQQIARTKPLIRVQRKTIAIIKSNAMSVRVVVVAAAIAISRVSKPQLLKLKKWSKKWLPSNQQ